MFELEAYPEAKSLSHNELRDIADRLGGFQQAASLIGASEAFVRQKVQRKVYKRNKATQPKKSLK